MKFLKLTAVSFLVLSGSAFATTTMPSSSSTDYVVPGIGGAVTLQACGNVPPITTPQMITALRALTSLKAKEEDERLDAKLAAARKVALAAYEKLEAAKTPADKTAIIKNDLIPALAEASAERDTFLVQVLSPETCGARQQLYAFNKNYPSMIDSLVTAQREKIDGNGTKEFLTKFLSNS